MVVAPSFSQREAAALREAAGSRAAIGLHLTLTAPFRPASHGFAPLRHGAFPSLAAMLHRTHLRAFKPELLTIEVVRQFEAFHAAFGRAPDFVDGHQHVQLLPQIGEAVLRVMKDAAPAAWVRQCGRTLPAHKRFADRKALLLDGLSRRFRRIAARHGVPHQPGICRRLRVPRPRRLRQAISGLSRRPAGRRRRHVPSGASRRRIARGSIR